MSEFENYDIGEHDQDKIIKMCSLDTKFLSLCIRKDIEPELFTSSVRSKTYELITNFYENYLKAPVTDFHSMVEEEIASGSKLRDEERELFIDYIVNIEAIDIGDITPEFLSDRLDSFIKKRVVATAIKRVLKLQDRAMTNPDRILELFRDSINKVDNISSSRIAESLLAENTYDFERDVVTRFGITGIDSQLGGGIQAGSFTIIVGYTSRGKSWTVFHLAKMAVRFGHSVLVVSIEMANKTAKMRLKMAVAGMSKREIREDPSAARTMVVSSLNRNADVFLLSDEEKGMRADDIRSHVDELEADTGKKIDVIIFDSADDIEPPPGNYRSKQEKSTAIYTYLKNYAKDTDKAVITTSQSQRIGGTKYWLSSHNVGDDINKVRRATVGISINGTEDEVSKGYLRWYLFKNTDGPAGAKCWSETNFNIGQIVTNHGEYNKERYDLMIKG